MPYGILLEDGYNILKENETLLLNEYPQDYTLTCDSGSYAMTGNNSSLFWNFKMACVTGVYALTGNSAILKWHLKLVCTTGSYVLTGASTTLKYAFKMVATTGSYVLTGFSALFSITTEGWTLRRKPTQPNYTDRTKPSSIWTPRTKP